MHLLFKKNTVRTILTAIYWWLFRGEPCIQTRESHYSVRLNLDQTRFITFFIQKAFKICKITISLLGFYY